MCTYPDCSEGDRNVLMTSESWLIHEKMYHRTIYRCETHPSLSFSTRAEYVEHVKGHHPEDEVELLNDDEIRNPASPVARPDRDCPFCLQTASNWEDMDKHIGFHLESLALLALPLTTGLERDSGQGENSIDSRNGEDGDAETRYAGYDAGHINDQSIPVQVESTDVLQGGDSLTGASMSAWEVHVGRHDLLPSIHDFVNSIDWSNIHHNESEGFDVLEQEARTATDGNIEDQNRDVTSAIQAYEEMDFAQLEPRDSLANRFNASFVTSTFDERNRDFLPENCIDELITSAAIRDELELDNLAKELPELDLSWQNTFVWWIIIYARKAFAILVLCNLSPVLTRETLMRFREGNFDDSQLPFGNPRLPIGVSLPMPWKNLFDRGFWNLSQLYQFYEAQWRCIVPVFSPREYEYDISSDYILPFTKTHVVKGDALSAVYRVTIHPAHQKHMNMGFVSRIVQVYSSRMLTFVTGCCC
jgi:hypothetical protein